MSGGIERYIENKKLYPITILPSVNKNVLDLFLKAGIVFCVDLLKMDEKTLMKTCHIDIKDAQKILEDVKILLNHHE